jgi:hypothetical protein
MYQIEVKQRLVQYKFPPADGWSVTVDIDSMERANGGTHPEGKAERARIAEAALRALGARIEKHKVFGRADVVAEHKEHGLWLVEVEGQSSKQKEQAMYSALGQLVLQMQGDPFHAAIAVPDEPGWQMQLAKVPKYARNILGLSCVLVSETGCRSAA